MSSNKIVSGILVLSCVLLLAFLGREVCRVRGLDKPVRGLSGKSTPDFTLSDLDGRSVSPASYKGKVVLLSFWAVGCPPCREEIPHLLELYEKYKDQGVVVLGVNCWDEPLRTVREYVEDQKITFPILLNGSRVAQKYRVMVVPSLFWIDRQGHVVGHHAGFHEAMADEFEAKLKALL